MSWAENRPTAGRASDDGPFRVDGVLGYNATDLRNNSRHVVSFLSVDQSTARLPLARPDTPSKEFEKFHRHREAPGEHNERSRSRSAEANAGDRRLSCGTTSTDVQGLWPVRMSSVGVARLLDGSTGLKSKMSRHRHTGLRFAGPNEGIVSLQMAILRILSCHPGGLATVAALNVDLAVLNTSGNDWIHRMRRLATCVPDLDLFSQGLVVRSTFGWQITDAGRALLSTAESRKHAFGENARSLDLRTDHDGLDAFNGAQSPHDPTI